MRAKRSDRYFRMYGPLLDYLRSVGGEAKSGEAARAVADLVATDATERERSLKSGGNAVENEVAWARNNLREAGLIDGSTRGVWRLTDEGWATKLTLKEARAIGRHRDILARREAAPDELPNDVEAEPRDLGSSSTLIDVIRSLSPSGFERLCRHLLIKAGFVDVNVTGQSSDGGIDGNGLLQVNELVSFQVLFQCKRYVGSVGAKEIRDFRGAMSGRTDKGIFISTGPFTREARAEATREGVPPIELVDSEKLVALMERLQIGVRPVTVFEVDEAFFRRFDS